MGVTAEDHVMQIKDRIKKFRDDLLQYDVANLVQRYITYGDCYALSNDEYFALKQQVAQNFKIHPAEVIVIGSAKLGFSIASAKRYREFGNSSDIDVALCSRPLFDEFWRDVFDYWARGEQWAELGEFRKYLFRGWMRPDKLPPSNSFTRSKEWWEFFRNLTATRSFGPCKITGALYSDWHYLEAYQQKCVHECKGDEEGIESYEDDRNQ